MERTQPSPTSVELWIRSFAPVSTGPSQERALECLETLERETGIETAVHVWGKEVECPSTRAVRSIPVPQLERIHRRLESFEEWARRAGRRLEPFFRRRRIESAITGERHEVWRLPTIALAEFDGENLLHVAPCTDGGDTVDVFDRFDVLASGENPTLQFDGDPRTRRDRPSNAPIPDRPSHERRSSDRRLESSPGPE